MLVCLSGTVVLRCFCDPPALGRLPAPSSHPFACDASCRTNAPHSPPLPLQEESIEYVASTVRRLLHEDAAPRAAGHGAQQGQQQAQQAQQGEDTEGDGSDGEGEQGHLPRESSERRLDSEPQRQQDVQQEQQGQEQQQEGEDSDGPASSQGGDAAAAAAPACLRGRFRRLVLVATYGIGKERLLTGGWMGGCGWEGGVKQVRAALDPCTRETGGGGGGGGGRSRLGATAVHPTNQNPANPCPLPGPPRSAAVHDRCGVQLCVADKKHAVMQKLDLPGECRFGGAGAAGSRVEAPAPLLRRFPCPPSTTAAARSLCRAARLVPPRCLIQPGPASPDSSPYRRV